MYNCGVCLSFFSVVWRIEKGEMLSYLPSPYYLRKDGYLISNEIIYYEVPLPPLEGFL